MKKKIIFVLMFYMNGYFTMYIYILLFIMIIIINIFFHIIFNLCNTGGPWRSSTQASPGPYGESHLHSLVSCSHWTW